MSVLILLRGDLPAMQPYNSGIHTIIYFSGPGYRAVYVILCLPQLVAVGLFFEPVVTAVFLRTGKK